MYTINRNAWSSPEGGRDLMGQGNNTYKNMFLFRVFNAVMCDSGNFVTETVLTSLLGFARWQSSYKGLPLGSI